VVYVSSDCLKYPLTYPRAMTGTIEIVPRGSEFYEMRSAPAEERLFVDV